MKFISKILLSGFAVIAAAFILPGVSVDTYWKAIVTALVISVLNFIVRPLFVLFTLPVTILTLGLFLFVINACIILIADYLVAGFEVATFWWALIFSLILSFFNAILYSLVEK